MSSIALDPCDYDVVMWKTMFVATTAMSIMMMCDYRGYENSYDQESSGDESYYSEGEHEENSEHSSYGEDGEDEETYNGSYDDVGTCEGCYTSHYKDEDDQRYKDRGNSYSLSGGTSYPSQMVCVVMLVQVKLVQREEESAFPISKSTASYTSRTYAQMLSYQNQGGYGGNDIGLNSIEEALPIFKGV